MSETETYLIDNWSYSSMMKFLENRFAFKKKYILRIFDSLKSPSALIGDAGHAALQAFYNGAKPEEAVQAGMFVIHNMPDVGVKWGKTGSREAVIKSYTQAIQFALEATPRPPKIEVLGVEQKITKFFSLNGVQFAIPAKSITDLVARDDQGRLIMIDHKFVGSFSDPEADKPKFAMQALFNFHTIREEYGEAPHRMIFDEIKISANKDGGPQLVPYEIVFDEVPDYFPVFYQLYELCTREVQKPDCQFLPNFNDMFDGDQTWLEFKDQLLTVEAPIVRTHKTQDVKFAERKFVESAPDMVENDYLPPEEKIRLKLMELALPVEMKETHVGANVILYTMKPSRGTRMSSFERCDRDLALALKASTIRVLAPIMGTNLVGVEAPNPDRHVIPFLDESQVPVERANLKLGTMFIPIGVDVYGQTIGKDLSDMPHLLVAGATGSGKSVMLNVIVRALTHQNGPEDLALVLIDPKRVELAQFKNLPHLMVPTIYDNKKAMVTLRWLVDEMEVRYQKLEDAGSRNIEEYNKSSVDHMKKIVVVVDEFADLILQGNTGEGLTAELAVVRLAQKARAVGIHLVIGTQRPSVDVVTGLIKANLPTRIAFRTSSQVDSRVILDQSGAEELNGKGDMLLLDPSERGLKRVQGFYC